jgi:hypothetical protein
MSDRGSPARRFHEGWGLCADQLATLVAKL